jgi:hypothetical protein
MWHEETGPAVRDTPPKCCRCGDSGRVWSCRLLDWKDCPDCAADRVLRTVHGHPGESAAGTPDVVRVRIAGA